MKTVIYISIFLTLISCSNENKLVSLVKFDGKYGFIDINGDWHIKPKFDSIGTFYNGYADFYKNGKNGIINSIGKIIIPNKYDFVGNVENDIALILLNDHYNYVDLNGHLISKNYFSKAEDFSEGLAPIQFNENGKWGYLDTNGNLKIDTLFNLAYEFKNGLAEVEIKTVDTTTIKAEYVVLQPKYYDCIIDKSGKIIDTVKYVRKKRKFPLIGSSDSNTLGKLNSSGDTIMKKKYKSFGYPQGKYMWYNTGEKYGLADTTGTILIKPIYEKLTYFSDNGLALARKNGKYGFINKKGEVVVGFKFTDATGFKYDLASVKLNNKWGFIDENGNFVIEPIFERIGHQFRPINAKFEPMYNSSRE